jgi:dienelactone hydrolase
MEFSSETTVDGVSTHHFVLGEVPGVLWTPPEPPTDRPLVLLVHGGGQHKEAPGVLARAQRFAGLGWAAAAIDAPGCGERPRTPLDEQFGTMLRARIAAGEPAGPHLARYNAERAAQAGPEWQATLDALQGAGHVGPVGIWGLSMGGAIAIPLVAAEPRIRAAVVGTVAPHEQLIAAARQIGIPVEYLVQWDDELIAREWSLSLFDAFASAEKSLQANPGPHAAVPHHRVEADALFLRRHLQPSTTM